MPNEKQVLEGEIVQDAAIVPRAEIPTDLQVSRAPDVVLREAQEAAKALADVIESKPKKCVLNGKTYLMFEDWQTVGRFYGISVGVEWTKYIAYNDVEGFESRAYALITKTGVHISAADAMCLNDEANWKAKPLFQLRSMAQTRACSKALRNVLAFVPVLAGYEPTPAEEMTQMGSAEAAQTVADQKIKELQEKMAAQPPKAKINMPPIASPSRTEDVLKASIQKAEEKDCYTLSGALGSTERKKGPAANYMLITLITGKNKEQKLNLFNNHKFQDETELWSLLEMAKGRQVSFLVKDGKDKKYNPTAVRLVKLMNMEFGEDGEIKRKVKDPEPLPAPEREPGDDDLSEYSL